MQWVSALVYALRVALVSESHSCQRVSRYLGFLSGRGANERPGADTGHRVLLAFQRHWPRAAHAGR